MAGFLKQHPDVCFSAVKEPHFFAQHDLTDFAPDRLRDFVDEEYLARFFGQCEDPLKLKAEGSVTYLYVPERMVPILKLWPDAKFVIALRDPLALLPSLHARLLVTGDETITDFAKAWAKIEDRRQGKSIPRTAMDPRWLRYDEAGAFGTRVGRFFEVVGRERCHVVLFDDLATDPRAEYRRLCDFLGLEPAEEVTNFKPRRVNHTFRFGWLQRFLKRPPKSVRSVLAGEKFRTREKRVDADEGPAIKTIFRLRKRLLDWNKVPAKRQPLDPVVKDQIIEQLRGEIIILSRLLDRDLSHWLGGVPEADPGRDRASQT